MIISIVSKILELVAVVSKVLRFVNTHQNVSTIDKVLGYVFVVRFCIVLF